jgi:rubrerythrin
MSIIATFNHTGSRAVRERLEQMLDNQHLPVDDAPAPGPSDEDMRMASIQESLPVGSRTDLPTEPAMATLLDSLGGRLAYERGGARLYDGLLRKAEAVGHLHGLRDCIRDLTHIREEEAEHAALLERVIEAVDGDPTLETPCADVEGVMSSGLLQVVHDPRTTLLECLRAAVVAELADVENWTSLARKLDGRVGDELATEVAEALEHEEEHLAMIRKWIAAAEKAPEEQSARAR